MKIFENAKRKKNSQVIFYITVKVSQGDIGNYSTHIFPNTSIFFFTSYFKFCLFFFKLKETQIASKNNLNIEKSVWIIIYKYYFSNKVMLFIFWSNIWIINKHLKYWIKAISQFVLLDEFKKNIAVLGYFT